MRTWLSHVSKTAFQSVVNIRGIIGGRECVWYTYTREYNDVIIGGEPVVHDSSDVETSADEENGEYRKYPAHRNHHRPFVVHLALVVGRPIVAVPSGEDGNKYTRENKNRFTPKSSLPPTAGFKIRADEEIDIEDEDGWHAAERHFNSK